MESNKAVIIIDPLAGPFELMPNSFQTQKSHRFLEPVYMEIESTYP